MLRVFLTLVLILGLGASASFLRAQPMPPAPGVEIPPSIRDAFTTKGNSPFEFQHAWIEKARIAKEKRERYIADRGFYKRDMMASHQQSQHAVSGTLRVPVFCVKYSDSPPGDPFPISQLQTKLFTGPFSPQTLTQYYNEISFGALNLTGTVYGWYTLPQPNAFYVGPPGCYGICEQTEVPQLVAQTIGANDLAVNFGQYDNDGPDGLPNSGDDDGYVDFVAIVQPEEGGECGDHTNIWSHRSAITPGITTNDARFGGGVIRVSDYVIQPIYNCSELTLIDIGVFCHEFGHALGLPDLYDPQQDTNAVGHWCLMGLGPWNTTSQPAHPGAWCRNELGWADLDVVSGQLDGILSPIHASQTVYRVDLAAQKFRWAGCWSGDPPALRCGLSEIEANHRNWAGGAGYGNEWDVSASRDFYFNGTGPVSFVYDCVYELEPNYDYAYVTITVGNTTSTLATHTGVGSDDLEHPINLLPYLTAPGPYTISFRLKSDYAYSDEDGTFTSTCFPLVIGQVSVNGGGENYTTLFTDRADGFAQDPSFTEYYLLENRQAVGSDSNLHGTGMLIWHIDQANQSGGINNDRPRGIEVVQADGLRDLEETVNMGDAGDPFPGTSNKMLFSSGTNPSSFSHSRSAAAWIQLLSINGDVMTVRMVGGFGPPSPEEVSPTAGESGEVVQLQIDGSSFKKTPTAELVFYVPEEEELRHGVVTADVIPATSVEWLGDDRILAEFDLTGAPNGLFNIVVHNPGGASSALEAGFTISGAPPTAADDTPRKFALSPCYPNPFNPTTTIHFELASRVHVDLRVYDVNGALVRTLVNETKPEGQYSLQWNGRNHAGNPVGSGVYFYRITAGEFSDVRKMTLLK